MGLSAGLGRCRKSRLHQDSIAGPIRYTDYAIPAHYGCINEGYFLTTRGSVSFPRKVLLHGGI